MNQVCCWPGGAEPYLFPRKPRQDCTFFCCCNLNSNNYMRCFCLKLSNKNCFAGLPSSYFPYKGGNYHAPLVAIQVPRFTHIVYSVERQVKETHIYIYLPHSINICFFDDDTEQWAFVHYAGGPGPQWVNMQQRQEQVGLEHINNNKRKIATFAKI